MRMRKVPEYSMMRCGEMRLKGASDCLSGVCPGENLSAAMNFDVSSWVI